MSARDRLVLMAIAAIAVLGAGWMLVVAPAREQESKVGAEVAAVRTQLDGVQGEISGAQSAQQRYHAAYASLATLGIAVPTSSEVPALMYTVDHATSRHRVEFTSISNGGGGSGSSGAAASASSAGSATAAGAQSAAFTQMPFTFTFAGSYSDLIKLLTQLEGFTAQGPSGTIRVSGRLLTIQSITFAAGASGGSSSSGGSQAPTGKPGEMTWTITATAYVLPASAPSAAGPGTPGTGTSGAAQPASSAGASPAGTPAVVRATP